jgi:hypothetical protein
MGSFPIADPGSKMLVTREGPLSGTSAAAASKPAPSMKPPNY